MGTQPLDEIPRLVEPPYERSELQEVNVGSDSIPPPKRR